VNPIREDAAASAVHSTLADTSVLTPSLGPGTLVGGTLLGTGLLGTGNPEKLPPENFGLKKLADAPEAARTMVTRLQAHAVVSGISAHCCLAPRALPTQGRGTIHTQWPLSSRSCHLWCFRFRPCSPRMGLRRNMGQHQLPAWFMATYCGPWRLAAWSGAHL